MNFVFYGLVLLSVVFALGRGFVDAPDGALWSHVAIGAVGTAAMDSAKSSVELALSLVGYMALFLGLMQVVQEAGGLDFLARLVRPVLVLLFPNVPPDHPAMGAMVMNIAANALGLGNAATPFGIKAMKELQELNADKGTATDAMVLFLAINTSGLALLPTGVIGLRASLGSADPAVIFPTTLFATAVSTITGIVAAKLLQRIFSASRPPSTLPDPPRAVLRPLDFLPFAGAVLAMGLLVAAVFTWGDAASALIIPLLLAGLLTVGVVRKVKVYEVFVKGAKEGFQLAVTIIPFLVAILVAVGMFRASGALDVLVRGVGPLTAPLGLPAEALPLAFLRPLSGSGAFGLCAEIMKTHGPDSPLGILVSTMNGSTETTFYVLAVYFGSVGVSRTRHAVPAGVAADIAGVIGSVLAVRFLLATMG